MSKLLRPNRQEAILYDPDLIDQISSAQFCADAWPQQRRLGANAGGRGSTYFVGTSDLSFALRHYYRGGLPGRVLRDQYLYLGEEASRSFREFRLLKELVRLRLPVPRPVAARLVRWGLIYRADLLTVRIPDVHSLAEALQQNTPVDWHAVGTTIRKFHEHDIYHADLNTHNIQLGSESVWLLDFDRGSIRAAGSWKESTLERLYRSMRKVTRGRKAQESIEGYWQEFLSAYAR
ncbi:MAG: 3-deoxy-D-manno-octulosonic acid kinase [Pseudomonadota bacterium]